VRALLVSILLLFASACATQAPAPAPVAAAPEYFALASSGTETVRLSKAPCASEKSLALMSEAHRDGAMAAHYSDTARGVSVPACWVPLGVGSVPGIEGAAVGVADEEGDAYVIPDRAFRPVGGRPPAAEGKSL